MNRISMRRNRLSEYRAVIFDLDGTLYYQKPFRMRMLLYLVGHIVRHPSAVYDVFLVKKYREVREKWEESGNDRNAGEDLDLDSRQYAFVAAEKKVSAERVRRAVTFFMLEAPLRLLPAYRDDVLFSVIEELRAQGIAIVVYSDYPVEGKLEALGIRADFCFTSADADIGCMKPNPKGLRVILERLGLQTQDAIMIGDRYEKDGLAAEGSGMDYMIVSASRKERKQLKENCRL